MRPSPIKHCNHCVLVNENLLLDSVEQYLSSIKFDDDIKSVLAKKLKNHYNVKNGNTYYHLNKCMEETETIKINHNLVDATYPSFSPTPNLLFSQSSL